MFFGIEVNEHPRKLFAPRYSLSGVDRRGGTYAVVLFLPSDLEVVVGSLGLVRLSPGYFIYVGSAFGSGGLCSRLGRHCTPFTPLRWQIDYLKPHMQVVDLWFTYDAVKRERDWAMVTSRMPGAACPRKHLGAMDFMNEHDSVESHFYHFRRRPKVATFRALARSMIQGQGPIRRVVRPSTPGEGHQRLPRTRIR